MKAKNRWSRLRGLLLLSLGVGLGPVLCISAIAGASISRASKPAEKRTVEQQRAQRKVIYLVNSSASAIPKPITWVTGIPTTATPMDVYGSGYVRSR